MTVRIRAIFSGRVQGVFFRAHTKRFADARSVSGWVRNAEDGRVEATFEGDDDAVRMVIYDCQHSQPYARVENVEMIEEKPTGEEKSFKIRY